jgi:hypothetical protein
MNFITIKWLKWFYSTSDPAVIKLLSILKEIFNSNIWVREWWSWIYPWPWEHSRTQVGTDLKNSQLPHSRIFELRIFLRILKSFTTLGPGLKMTTGKSVACSICTCFLLCFKPTLINDILEGQWQTLFYVIYI